MSKGPNGLTHRQERFCRNFAAGFNATRAATGAGYRALWAANHGHRLLRQPRIRARVAAIQAEMAAEACDGTGVLLGKLESVYRAALEGRNYQAAARAVDLQAKLARMAAAAGPVEAAQAPESKGENGKMTRNDEVFFGRPMRRRLVVRTCRI